MTGTALAVLSWVSCAQWTPATPVTAEAMPGMQRGHMMPPYASATGRAVPGPMRTDDLNAVDSGWAIMGYALEGLAAHAIRRAGAVMGHVFGLCIPRIGGPRGHTLCKKWPLWSSDSCGACVTKGDSGGTLPQRHVNRVILFVPNTLDGHCPRSYRTLPPWGPHTRDCTRDCIAICLPTHFEDPDTAWGVRPCLLRLWGP